jgi:xylulokinase
MATRLLGIDIGTTGVRAAVFSADGQLLADASDPCPYVSPFPGWAEIDPNEWWKALGRAMARIDVSQVDAIAVVGQAPTAVLLGTNEPAILWLDTRATLEGQAMGVESYYLGPKLRWLDRNRDIKGVQAIVQSHAYITYRLTGQLATDPSTAALCLPHFDLAAREWLPNQPLFPPIHPAHSVIGTVRANDLGLREGTPVVAGGGDFAAATLGAGVVAEGEACLMLGTAGNLLVPRTTPGRDRKLINAHHVGVDLWLSLGGTLSGGAQEWARKALGDAPHAELDEEAAKVPAGGEGLLFLPYLQGERTPIWDPHARGAYVGLGLNHARGHMWRAVLEGIALSFVDCQQVIEAEGVTLKEIVAANGGGKSALFRQILCDALGVPLAYTPVSGGTVAGAAILAGLGIRAFTTPRPWPRLKAIQHTPNKEAHAHYRALLPIRRGVYASLKPSFASLSDAV